MVYTESIRRVCFMFQWEVINSKICDQKNLNIVSQILNLTNTNIENYDYQRIIIKIKENDFIYLDPPYYPLNETSNFTNYTSYGFDYMQQRRLADFFLN